MPGCYICPKPGRYLNWMVMSPRSTSPLHTFSMFQGFVRQKSTNHTCLNKHFLHTTKSELFSACTSSLLRELTLNRESREGSKNEISSSFKLHYGYFTSLNLPKVSDFFKNFKKMHPEWKQKKEKGGLPRVFTSLKRTSYIRWWSSESEIFSPWEALQMRKNLWLKIRL